MGFRDKSRDSSIQSSWSSNSQCIFLTNPVVLLSNLVDPPTSSGFPWPIQWFIYPIQFILLPSMGFPDQSSCSSIQSSWSSYPQWVFLTNPLVHLSNPVDPDTINRFSWLILWFIYTPSNGSLTFNCFSNQPSRPYPIWQFPYIQLVFPTNPIESQRSLAFNWFSDQTVVRLPNLKYP